MFSSQDVLLMVQSLTECLPISSSAHVLAVSNFMDVGHLDVFYQNFWLHLVPFLSFIAVFYQDVRILLTAFFKNLIHPKNLILSLNPEIIMLRCLIIATLPLVCACFLMGVLGIHIRESLKWMAFNSILFGGIMIVADFFGERKNQPQNWLGQQQAREGSFLTTQKAAWIGWIQCLALLPGVSRMGISLTMARFLGISRFESLRFSCLTGMPFLLGAGSFALVKQILHHSDLMSFSVYVVLSALVLGFLALFLLVRSLAYSAGRFCFFILGIYRIFFGVFLLCFC